MSDFSNPVEPDATRPVGESDLGPQPTLKSRPVRAPSETRVRHDANIQQDSGFRSERVFALPNPRHRTSLGTVGWLYHLKHMPSSVMSFVAVVAVCAVGAGTIYLRTARHPTDSGVAQPTTRRATPARAHRRAARRDHSTPTCRGNASSVQRAPTYTRLHRTPGRAIGTGGVPHTLVAPSAPPESASPEHGTGAEQTPGGPFSP
jgi:hypothetical protein